MKIAHQMTKSLAFLALFAVVACGSKEKDPAEKGAAPAAKKAPAAATSAPAAAAPAPADASDVPTDEQIKKDIAGTAGGIISIEIDKQPGKKEWNSAHSQYFWEKWVTITRNPNLAEMPDAKLKVGGYARYEVTAGRYNYREFKVATNEYVGMPRPTDAEALEIVKAHLNDMLAGRGGMIVNGDKIEVSLATGDAQNWEWDSPKVVSFNINMKYDQATSNTQVESKDVTLRARIFRDDPKGPWLRAIGMDEKVNSTSTKTYTAAELSAMPRGIPNAAPRPGGRTSR